MYWFFNLFYLCSFSSLFFFINQPTLAQVVIEEEVVLDSPTGIETATLNMPFYGSAYFDIYTPLWGPCNWTSGIVCFMFSAGNQSSSSAGCGQPCNGDGNWKNIPASFLNIPMGQPVSITIQRCANGWHDVPVRFVLETANLNSIVYGIWAINISNGEDCRIGTLRLNATTPPGCGSVQICDYEPPELYFKKIESASYTLPNNKITNVTVEACTANVPGGQAGGMKMAPWHIPEGSSWEIFPCFNPAIQKVKFPFKFNIDGQLLNVVPYVYLVGMCDNPSGSGYTIIESKAHLNTLLGSGQINASKYCTVLSDFCAHYGEENLAATYILKEVVMAHENMHFDEYYKKYFKDNISDLYKSLSAADISCSDYIANPDAAKLEAKKRLSNVFEAYNSLIEKELNKYGRDKIEEELNSTRVVHDLIKPYKRIIEEKMRQGHVQCPDIPSCNNFNNATF